MTRLVSALFAFWITPFLHADLDHLRNAIQIINDNYVNDVNAEKLQDGAIEGILHAFDPHSQYLSNESLKMLQDQTSGHFAGIGVEIEYKDGLLTIVSPIDQSPAAKAGIQSGDIITAIDHQPTNKLPLIKIIEMIRGEVGSQVSLKIQRGTNNQLTDIVVTRDIIATPTVTLTYPNNHVANIRIASFNEQTLPQLKEAITDIINTPKVINGLIIDLRNNPGGLLHSAVQTADLFLDANQLDFGRKIVYIKGKYENSVAYATPNESLKGLPIIVLINHGSASAAEIVALALKEHNRAVILGQQSFGKGSVQSIIPLDDQSAIKLTTALYYSPKGTSIQAKGVTPDVFVDLRERDQTQPQQAYTSEAQLLGESATINTQTYFEDPYIQQAIDLLQAHYALND
ncbi:MAG: S41 family peptidase [Candidatus Comchoanobacterales bacterium]